jgi:hypothetical protein
MNSRSCWQGSAIGHHFYKDLLSIRWTVLERSEFHDWYTSSYGPNQMIQTGHHIRTRPFLPDEVPIVFKHADLHPSNILHQSGWYPAYWEYCKARWTSWVGKEWETEYTPIVLDRHSCYDYGDSFGLARGT